MQSAPARLEDLKAEVHDPLEEVKLGIEENKRVTYISKLLDDDLKKGFIDILKEFKDCFAWEHHEMPGVSIEVAKHKLPIKEGFKPVIQGPRRMSAEVIGMVKDEIERLVKANFIRPVQYGMAGKYSTSHQEEWQNPGMR